MRLFSLAAVAAALTLTACATAPSGSTASSGTTSTSASVATPTQTQQFMTAVEAKRGTALTYAEKVQVQGLAGATKLGLNSAQTRFLDRVGAQVGLNGAVIAALFPEAGKPISETAVVSKLESRLGKPLTAADQAAVKAATALRNNSVGNLKTSLATGIGSRLGMDTQTVLALMPLLGF